MKIKAFPLFVKICVNFPCKLEAPFDVCSNQEICSVGVVDRCPSASALQEPETDKEVPERMGAAAAAENDPGLLWQVAGRQRRAEDRVHVQAQHLQDGLCLQVRRLHVQTYGTDTGSPGEHRKHFHHLHYQSGSSVPVWRHLDLQLSCLVDLSFSPTSGSTLACTHAFRPGWTPGPRNTWAPAWRPTPTSGWWEKTKRVCWPAPPPATPRSFTISALTSTGWSTEPCSFSSPKAKPSPSPRGWMNAWWTHASRDGFRCQKLRVLFYSYTWDLIQGLSLHIAILLGAHLSQWTPVMCEIRVSVELISLFHKEPLLLFLKKAVTVVSVTGWSPVQRVDGPRLRCIKAPCFL